jgi:hypothetical protein
MVPRVRPVNIGGTAHAYALVAGHDGQFADVVCW